MALTTRFRIDGVDQTTGWRHSVRYGPSERTQTLAGGGGPGTIKIDTVATPVALTRNDTGLVYVRNLDSTNYVRFGPTGAPWLRIGPGEENAFTLDAGQTLEGIANTAAVFCDIRQFER